MTTEYVLNWLLWSLAGLVGGFVVVRGGVITIRRLVDREQ